MAYYDAPYGCDNNCPIYEGERLNCDECGECYYTVPEYLLIERNKQWQRNLSRKQLRDQEL